MIGQFNSFSSHFCIQAGVPQDSDPIIKIILHFELEREVGFWICLKKASENDVRF